MENIKKRQHISNIDLIDLRMLLALYKGKSIGTFKLL